MVFGDAEAYERFMGRWSALVAPRFLDAVGPSAPRRVLDVGAGTGNLARAAADRWPAAEVLGVDPSPTFVASARARTGAARRLGFSMADATELPLAAGSTDVALALLVLNFVPDADRAVAEMRRVTRPGGVVAAAVWDYGDGMGMLRVLWDAASGLDPSVTGQDEGAMPLARADGLPALLRGGGLDEVEHGAIEVVTRFSSFDDYWEPFLLGTGPAGAYVSGLSDAGRSALRLRLAAELGNGPFELPARAWWARGTVPG